jgi:SAM-dependent methyltransferase
MSSDSPDTPQFDRFANAYESMHASSIRASGEDPSYFSAYKCNVMRRVLGPAFDAPVLDFGCGIGNLTTFLVDTFPDVHGYEPSTKSVEQAVRRSQVSPSPVGDAPVKRGPVFHTSLASVPKGHFGAIVVANVLHHVIPAERASLIDDAVRCLRPGGKLFIFEHNPLNPLTLHAVRSCEFDDDAILLWPWEVTRLLSDAKLTRVRRDFIVFFPKPLAAMRPLEPRLRFVPIGAQVAAWGERT